MTIAPSKVMGWEKHEVELDLTDGGTQKFFDSWRLNGREVAVQWNPLQSIADAWMVVEKLFIAVVPQSPNAPDDMRFHATKSHLPSCHEKLLLNKTVTQLNREGSL